MDPSSETPVPDKSDDAAAGSNGVNGTGPTDPCADFPGPAPIRLSEEELDRLRAEISEEEILALLQEMRETGSISSEELLRSIEEAAAGNG